MTWCPTFFFICLFSAMCVVTCLIGYRFISCSPAEPLSGVQTQLVDRLNLTRDIRMHVLTNEIIMQLPNIPSILNYETFWYLQIEFLLCTQIRIENSAYISIQHKRNLGNTNLGRHTKFGLKEVSTWEFSLREISCGVLGNIQIGPQLSWEIYGYSHFQ